jgi:hypothetical protein
VAGDVGPGSIAVIHAPPEARSDRDGASPLRCLAIGGAIGALLALVLRRKA